MCNLSVIGWDVGGAHLKAVALNAEGEIMQILQLPCALWKGLDHLEVAVQTVLTRLNISPFNLQHSITMTGELVDLFVNRHHGVIQIATVLESLLTRHAENMHFYAANHGFVRFKQVSLLSKSIASANWHASASALANDCKEALLIDIGSTTTDIIPIASGKVDIQSITDAERMQTDYLVYSGVIRTPVMALGNKLLFNSVETNVAAEYFATMADVYRLTGELPQDADMADTADGKGKSMHESATRLARMVGHDLEDKPMQAWKDLALVCRDKQVSQIKTAVLKHLKHLKPNIPIIGAGAGAFLVNVIAEELGHHYFLASHFLQKNDHHLALEVCFPAYAVASLYLALNPQQIRQHSHA